MIKVKNVIKNYGNFRALKGVSFEAQKNTITALLGPNGAGKTTTLRILSGYLFPDDGDIEYFGKNYKNSDFKNLIGYVPENNPIYEDLEVSEYLNWISKIYGVDSSNVKTVIDKCSLKDVIGKKIGSLSKGYKQRVSLAKAIIHNPPILLLDEPTSGLDPNQANQTKELIKDLKGEKTVIISTHILSEAESICDNILIINKGEIQASGKIDEIIKQYSRNSYTLKIEGKIEIDFSGLKEIKEIAKTYYENEVQYIIEFNNEKDMRKEILEYLISKKISLLEFYKNRITLEEIFTKITKEN
ncbi:MAG: ATP-binding cassette domain-containing protein [Elusimicrobiota bacterium]